MSIYMDMKIKQRTKGTPMQIEVNLSSGQKIEVTITPPHDVMQWFEILRIEPEELGRAIQSDLVGPIIDHLLSNPARGVHSGRKEFMHDMKGSAAYLYHLISYWLKKPKDVWPEPLKEMVDWLEKLPAEQDTLKVVFDASGRKREHPRLQPLPLTIFFMERRFGRERKRHGLKPWSNDPEGFRKIFLTEYNEATENGNRVLGWMEATMKALTEGGVELPINLPFDYRGIPSEMLLLLLDRLHRPTPQE